MDANGKQQQRAWNVQYFSTDWSANDMDIACAYVEQDQRRDEFYKTLQLLEANETSLQSNLHALSAQIREFKQQQKISSLNFGGFQSSVDMQALQIR